MFFIYISCIFMLFVKTKVKPSNIHWLGLFADEFIPQWTIVWKFTPWFDLKFSYEEIQQFPEHIQEYMFTYTWLSKKSGLYCFSSDNGKYFNHSPKPNTLSAYYEDEEEVVTKAIRDIQKWEEITDDYNSFEEASRENFI